MSREQNRELRVRRLRALGMQLNECETVSDILMTLGQIEQVKSLPLGNIQISRTNPTNMSTKETLPIDADKIIEKLRSFRGSVVAEIIYNDAANLIGSLRTRLDAAEKELFSTHDLFDRAHKRAELAEAELTKVKEANAELVRNHSIFVAIVQGGLFGLSTHPSDEPLNGCLISAASKQKLMEIYSQVLKERQAINAAVAKGDKTFWKDAVNKAGGTQ